jgi:hypothetical protein
LDDCINAFLKKDANDGFEYLFGSFYLIFKASGLAEAE